MREVSERLYGRCFHTTVNISPALGLISAYTILSFNPMQWSLQLCLDHSKIDGFVKTLILIFAPTSKGFSGTSTIRNPA